MVQEQNGLDTKALIYHDVDEFKQILETVKPARMHTYFQGGFLGIGSNWAATFQDSDGIVHGFMTVEVKEGFEERINPLYELVKSGAITEVDGMIKLSEKQKAVYHVFETEKQSDEEAVNKSYNAWIDAVKTLPVEETLIQYLNDGEHTIVDATRGTNHYIKTLSPLLGKTLEDALEDLQTEGEGDNAKVVSKNQYKLQDNMPVIAWYTDMKNE